MAPIEIEPISKLNISIFLNQLSQTFQLIGSLSSTEEAENLPSQRLPSILSQCRSHTHDEKEQKSF